MMRQKNHQSESNRKTDKIMMSGAASGRKGDPALTRLLSVSAQKQITRDAPERWDGCLVYRVEQVWTADILKHDDTIGVAIDCSGLRRELSNNRTCAVFIPSGSSLTKRMARQICTGSGQTKTIYLEDK